MLDRCTEDWCGSRSDQNRPDRFARGRCDDSKSAAAAYCATESMVAGQDSLNLSTARTVL